MSFENKDLNLLIALRALLEEANVTRAGARVDMGQSSMSTALSRLRAQFGDELLVRVGRDYELTPLARLILPQLEVAIPLIENALMSHEEFSPATTTRTFKIMASDAAQLQLKPLITKAMLEAPGMSVEYYPIPAQPTDSEREMLVNDFVVAVAGMGIHGESHPL
jgi:DNA-binding transcriptional LysR family regulator